METIIPIDDKLNNSAIYNIKIRSSLNCNDSWIKSCTLDDLFNFREYLLKYSHYVINLPFPKKSWMRFLPYIGHKYDERNWDILLENKFFLDVEPSKLFMNISNIPIDELPPDIHTSILSSVFILQFVLKFDLNLHIIISLKQSLH